MWVICLFFRSREWFFFFVCFEVGRRGEVKVNGFLKLGLVGVNDLWLV